MAHVRAFSESIVLSSTAMPQNWARLELLSVLADSVTKGPMDEAPLVGGEHSPDKG